MKKIIFFNFLLSIFWWIVWSLWVNYVQDNYFSKTLYQEFYDMENEIIVSPHRLRKSIAEWKNDFVLVDLRSEEEYINSHIIWAVNIPAYKDQNTTAYGDVERITSSFLDLKKQNPDKDIIVYCYSISCWTARKVWQMLANNWINVKHLWIWWNEWRYYWNLWNHEWEWSNTRVEDYIYSWKEPWKFETDKDFKPCPIENEFWC